MAVPITVTTPFDPGTIGSEALAFVGPYLTALLAICTVTCMTIGIMRMFNHYAKRLPGAAERGRDRNRHLQAQSKTHLRAGMFPASGARNHKRAFRRAHRKFASGRKG